MATSKAFKKSKPSKALVEARALRNEAQAERHRVNVAHASGGGLTTWQMACRDRKMRRANDPNVQMQPRTVTGMIINRDGTLKFDTVRARNEALIAIRERAEEQAALDLEKRKARAKAKQARANRHEPGEVTVRKSK